MNRRELSFLVLIVLVIGIFQAHVAQKLESFSLGEDHGSYYPLLTDSLLAGRLDLLVRPSAELLALSDPYDPMQNTPYRLFHDASLYQGRYYLSYGVAPALTFFIPYRLLFGRNMSESFAVFLQTFLAVLFFAGLLIQIWKRQNQNQRVSFFNVLGGIVLFSMTTGLPLVLARPLFYEVTTTGALLWITGALFFLYESFYAKERTRWIWLALGSASLGLAAGTRPQFLLAGLILIPLFKKFKRPVFIFGPWCVVLGGVALYNFLRFHNPFEFGMSYSLLGHSHSVEFYSLRRLVDNLIAYCFEYPRFDGIFPFLHLGRDPLSPLIVKKGDMMIFPVVGLLFICPFLFVEGARQIWFRKKIKRDKPPAVQWASLSCLLIFALMFLVMGGFIGIAIRYTVDFFAPFLALLILNRVTEISKPRTAVTRCWITAVVVAGAVGVMTSGLLSLSPEWRDDTVQHVVEALASQEKQDMKSFSAVVGPATSYEALIETSMGKIKCRLYSEEAPRAVENFIDLAEGRRSWTDVKNRSMVKAPFYVNQNFYGVDASFKIETGDQLGNGLGGPGYLLMQEWRPRRHLLNAGQLVMSSARQAFGSQFFITTRPTPWLEFTNTVFGEVMEGMDVVRKISLVPVDSDLHPLTPVILKNVVILRNQ